MHNTPGHPNYMQHTTGSTTGNTAARATGWGHGTWGQEALAIYCSVSHFSFAIQVRQGPSGGLVIKTEVTKKKRGKRVKREFTVLPSDTPLFSGKLSPFS